MNVFIRRIIAISVLVLSTFILGSSKLLSRKLANKTYSKLVEISINVFEWIKLGLLFLDSTISNLIA